MGNTYVEMIGITKRFGEAILANNDVSFDVEEGEVHCLLGENGAGKTTLMNILFGHLRPESGVIRVGGNEVVFRSPRDALQHGIGMVHQHLSLVPTFTVAENVVLGLGAQLQGPGKGRATSLRHIRKKVEDAARQFGMALDGAAVTSDLPIGLQQQVEILKILYRGVRVLVLDEPTSLLGPEQIDGLFAVISDLRRNGHSIVMVTHKLREIMELADRVTVLRQGVKVLTVRRGEVTEAGLVTSMTGRVVGAPVARTAGVRRDRPPRLELRGIALHAKEAKAALEDLNLRVYPGEIIGIAGVQGNGQRELVDVLVGLRRPDRGELILGGRRIPRPNPALVRSLGVGVIPEDRHRWGLMLDLSLAENVQISRVLAGSFLRRGFVNWREVESDAARRLERFDVRPADPREPVARLSGGNQQRVVLAREMADGLQVLVAHNPTWGLDVGAASYVHNRLMEFRDEGGAVILLSLDLDEILRLADRVVVMYRGGFALDSPSAEVSMEKLGAAMAGASVV